MRHFPRDIKQKHTLDVLPSRRVISRHMASMAKKMACVQYRVEKAELTIMLPVLAAGSAAVNGNVVAASEGGRLRKSAYMGRRHFAAGVSHLPTSAISFGE